MTKKRNRAIDIQVAQQSALVFAQDYLGRNAMNLPNEIDEATFAAVMNAITRGLVQAYAKGWMDSQEQS